MPMDEAIERLLTERAIRSQVEAFKSITVSEFVYIVDLTDSVINLFHHRISSGILSRFVRSLHIFYSLLKHHLANY